MDLVKLASYCCHSTVGRDQEELREEGFVEGLCVELENNNIKIVRQTQRVDSRSYTTIMVPVSKLEQAEKIREQAELKRMALMAFMNN